MNPKLNNEIRKAHNQKRFPKQATQKEAIKHIKSNIKKNIQNV